MHDVVRDEILASLPAKTKKEVADRIGRKPDDYTFRQAWKALEQAGAMTVEDGRAVRSHSTGDRPPPSESSLWP